MRKRASSTLVIRLPDRQYEWLRKACANPATGRAKYGVSSRVFELLVADLMTEAETGEAPPTCGALAYLRALHNGVQQ